MGGGGYKSDEFGNLQEHATGDESDLGDSLVWGHFGGPAIRKAGMWGVGWSW